MDSPLDIAGQRLVSQGIAHPASASAEGVVTWLGAVQAQDYPAAKWALGLRMQTATDPVVERAFAEGAILRTHVLRPTWHFVTPKDIRWMLALSAPRIHAASAHRHRQLGLNDAVFRRCEAVLEKALRDRSLTRGEVRSALERGGIAVNDGARMAHLMMHAELEGVICSGPRCGNQFTYALLGQRVRRAPTFPRDEALARLADRFFTSRGPATVHDFAKWSWLTVGDATRGLDAVSRQFDKEVVAGRSYWFSSTTPPVKRERPTAHLLPVFDEYLSSYNDRTALVLPKYRAKFAALGSLGPVVVVDGQIAGVWKRRVGPDAVSVEIQPLWRLTSDAKRAVRAAAERYGTFLDMPVVMAATSRTAAV